MDSEQMVDRPDFVQQVLDLLRDSKEIRKIFPPSYWAGVEDPTHLGGPATFIKRNGLIIARVHSHKCQHAGEFEMASMDFACIVGEYGFRTADPRVLLMMIIGANQ
jgi:hypothetical protein